MNHWIWYIFPQIKGLGHSPNAQFYGIRDLDEAKIDGVISKTKNRISFKNDDDDILYDKMIELRNKILVFVGLGDVSESNWRRYYDNFQDKINKDIVVGISGKEMPKSALPGLIYTTESIDSIVKKAINKLDEFTIKDLEDETGINDKGFLREKIDFLVKSGKLEAIGTPARRKYRRKL